MTTAEYINAPTSVDYNNLVVGGNAAAQTAELNNVIIRASSFMDEYLNQNLNASTQTENQRMRFNSQGYLALHPNNSPVISLNSFSWGSDPNNLSPLNDCSTAWFEDQQVIIPVSQLSTTWSSAGPLSFGNIGNPSQPVFVRYNYTSGYVNNLMVSAIAGASSMTVQDATGVVAGMQLRIFDGASSEKVTVASNYTYGSTTIPLISPLGFNHVNGVAFGNLPNTIKQAAILVTTGFIKLRGDSSMTMAMTASPSRTVSGTQLYGAEISMALQMLDLYKRVR